MPDGVCANGGFAVPWPFVALKRLGLSATEQSRADLWAWQGCRKKGATMGQGLEAQSPEVPGQGEQWACRPWGRLEPLRRSLTYFHSPFRF